ncbi:hypothetical protein HPB47_019057, partial [Ixodes persulcatus]
MVQLESESFAAFVAELPKLTQACAFEAALEQPLRACFVCGLRGEDIRHSLFAEDNRLAFHGAVERVLAIEAAKKRAWENRT